jgi:hypothetical protein
MALHENQILIAADQVVAVLRHAATEPGNIHNGVVAAYLPTLEIINNLTMNDAGDGAGVWAIRNSMDQIASAAALKLGLSVGMGGLDWDVGGPALGKSYLFNAPADAVLSVAEFLARIDGNSPVDVAAIRKELDASTQREQALRGALGNLCRTGEYVKAVDAYILTREQIEAALRVLTSPDA